MIALWMLSAIVFTAFLSAAAWWGERALRSAGRPARGVWLFALVAGAVWPVMVPMLRRLRPSSASVTLPVAMLDAVRIVPERVSSGVSWLPLLDRMLVIGWVAVSLLLLLRYLLAWRAVHMLRQSAERSIVDGVPVLVSRDLGPAVVGVRDATVLVPRAVLELDASLRALVLRHEQEHVRARDTWLLLALATAVAALPWNAPLWWIARRARLALEVDCDARVLAAGGSSTRYVQVLLLAAQRTSAAPLTPMLVASRTHLERRIVAMQERIAQEAGAGRTLRVIGATLACVAAFAVACSSPIAEPPAPVRSADAGTATTRPQVVSPNQPFFEFQVEKQVTVVAGSPRPRYPEALKASNVSGEVLAQYVVNADGNVDMSSFRVLKSPRAEFVAAVKDVLPTMHFTAAEVGGRKVRQLVQQLFVFSRDQAGVAGPATSPNPTRSSK